MLRGLAEALKNNHFRMVGQVPAEADLLGRVRDWLTRNCNLSVAATPRV
jgi:hypothetical protein